MIVPNKRPADKSSYNNVNSHVRAVAREAMRAYLQTTGFIFGVVTLGHALRLVLHWPVQLAG